MLEQAKNDRQAALDAARERADGQFAETVRFALKQGIPMTDVARMLSISRSNLYRLLNLYPGDEA